LQQAQKHQSGQPACKDDMEFSSTVKSTTSALGGLFDILKPSSGYDENQAEVFRQEAKKRRKKKANQYRQRL
jgi:hypothetical protein